MVANLRETPTSSLLLACYSDKRGDRYSKTKQLREQNDQSKRSEDVVVIEDDIPAAIKNDRAGWRKLS